MYRERILVARWKGAVTGVTTPEKADDELE